MHQIRASRWLGVLMGSSFLLSLAFGIYRSVFQNFAGQELGIGPGSFGLLEGIREIPGLLTIVLVALATRIGDERLYTISSGFLGAGIGLYAMAHTFSDLVIATLVQSIGFHIWYVVQDAMVLKSVEPGARAGRLGQLNSASAAATLVGMGIVATSARWMGLRPYFIFAGLFGVAGALWSMRIKHRAESHPRTTFVFRWRYRSYYTLTLLSGARRHIVLTFAAFALVKLYGASTQTMALLLAAHSALAIWTRPLIGKLIDRMGEQRALSMNYGIVALVFIGYALARTPWLLYALFILDNILTGFDIAISTHAGRLIPRDELSSSLATGTTINHIFGVMVPIIGGFLWEWFGPLVPFLMGAGIVLVAMAYSWDLDVRVSSIAPSAHVESG